MKHKLNRLSQTLFLSGSIFASSITPALSADDLLPELQLAMNSPASILASRFYTAKLSPAKMLEKADKLNQVQIDSYEGSLKFALVFASAKKGSAEAQFRLASYYINGDVVALDESEASFWLEEAITQNHKGAKALYDALYYAENFEIGC